MLEAEAELARTTAQKDESDELSERAKIAYQKHAKASEVAILALKAECVANKKKLKAKKHIH